MTVPVFLVDRERLVESGTVHLDGAEGRHAATVRRLLPGERVMLTDGCGLRVEGRVTGVARDQLDVAVETRTQDAAPQPRLVVIQALPKGDRGELAVELMTEVGVDVVVPWAASRCITQWKDARGERALARWRSTAREAAKQARRSWVPDVRGMHTTTQVAELLSSATTAVVLHQEASTALSSLTVSEQGDVVVVVGPEGGITPDELHAFTAADAHCCRLGRTVLRTSTAGTAALAALLSRTDRWR